MKNKKNILREAAVLLIVIAMFMSIVVTSTPTQVNTIIGAPKCEITSLPKNILPHSLEDNVVLWYNNPMYWSIGYHSQDDPPEDPRQWDSFVADDFIFENETEVKWLWWQIYYANAPGKDYHYDWNVTFFEDDGTGNSPGAIFAGPFTIADEDIGKSFPYFNETNRWACAGTAYLPEPVSFNADTKYWITIYSIGSIYPQTFLPCHNETMGGILLHEAKFKSEHWGFPDWTDLSDPELYGQPLDVNFILGGDPGFDVKIKKGLGVTITLSNNLPASDEYTGHNMTVNCTATGGYIFLNPTKNVLLDEFPGQTTETFRWFPIGFGKITINVAGKAIEAGVPPVEEEARLLLFLLI